MEILDRFKKNWAGLKNEKKKITTAMPGSQN